MRVSAKKSLAVVICTALLLCLLTTSCQKPARIDPSELTGISRTVETQIEDGNIPGAVVLVAQNDETVYHKAFGSRIIEPIVEPATPGTIYDLASLTKPIATATSVLILVDRGRINLSDRVTDYLPQFGQNGKEDVRIVHLLTHTSGLPAYTNANTLKSRYGSPCPDKVIEKICSLTAVSEPGREFRYSCLGYITLAEIVQIVTGQDIAKFSRTNIFEPLGMNGTSFNPPPSRIGRIAATEIIGGKPLRGTVHDPLARLNGGISGNAGLFSTAEDLAIYCRMLLNDGILDERRILSSGAVELLTTTQSHGRACGFDLSSGYSWIKGRYAPPQAFCHSGYTGTSIVVDPATEIAIIILANRVHPDDSGTTRPLRTGIADAVFSACGYISQP